MRVTPDRYNGNHSAVPDIAPLIEQLLMSGWDNPIQTYDVDQCAYCDQPVFGNEETCVDHINTCDDCEVNTIEPGYQDCAECFSKKKCPDCETNPAVRSNKHFKCNDCKRMCILCRRTDTAEKRLACYDCLSQFNVHNFEYNCKRYNINEQTIACNLKKLYNEEQRLEAQGKLPKDYDKNDTHWITIAKYW